MPVCPEHKEGALDLFFCFLYLIWILLNARVTPEVLWIGLAVTGLIALFSGKTLGYSFRRDFRLFRLLPGALGCLLFLLGQVIISAWRVMRLVWKPGPGPVSAVASFRPAAHTRAGRVILADSITLTPGTITLESEEGTLTVHCLEEGAAQSLSSCPMDQKIRRLEESRP